MILVKENGLNRVKIPKNGINFEKNTITLKLKSELTQKEAIFEDLEDLSNNSTFYDISVDFSGISDGEYTYLLNDGVWTSRGLMRIGNVCNVETTEYDNKIEITEYKYE